MGLAEKVLALVEEVSSKTESTSTSRTVRNVIGFYGAKSGLGCSTLVANVAIVLATNNAKVCVIDCNPHMPMQYRFLTPKKKLKEIVSFKELFINSALELAELFNDTKYNKLKLVTSSPFDSPDSFMDMPSNTIDSMIRGISQMVDYVLLDLGGADIAYETTTTGLSCCEQLFTVVTPNIDVVENTFKMFQFFRDFKCYMGEVYVIQNKVLDDPLKKSVLERFGMVHLLDLPFWSDIMRLHYNDQLIVQVAIGGKASLAWKNSILGIASTIRQLSDASNYKVEEDTVEAVSVQNWQPGDEIEDADGDHRYIETTDMREYDMAQAVAVPPPTKKRKGFLGNLGREATDKLRNKIDQQESPKITGKDSATLSTIDDDEEPDIIE